MRVERSTVLVIGGTGFIGRAVVRELLTIGSCNVIATSRDGNANSSGSFQYVKWLACDVTEESSVISAAVGADCVINCYRDNESEAVSAKAIENILRACEVNKISKLIYLSSVAIYGSASGVVDEWSPPLSPIGWYGRAKSHAERACQAKASPSFQVAILRPTLVYGPGGEEWFLRFLRSIKTGALGNLGQNGEGLANLIYVADLARMCSRLALSPVPSFLICIANGSDRITFNEYFEEIRTACGDGIVNSTAAEKCLRNVASKCRRPARGILKLIGRIGSLVPGNPFEQLLKEAVRMSQECPEDIIEDGYKSRTYFSPKYAESLGLTAPTQLSVGVASSFVP